MRRFRWRVFDLLEGIEYAKNESSLSFSGLGCRAFVMCGRFYQEHAQVKARNSRRVPHPPLCSVAWPLPATGKAYGAIDGKHLWQYVKEQADIARRYRDQGHPQFWGRIAGTSGDVESAQWLLKKYQQIGLTDTHIQPVAFFHPQWAPESWEVTATAGGKTMTLTSAQPPYGAASTDGKVLDLPAVYVGLGSEADFAGRDVRGKAVLLFREGLVGGRAEARPGQRRGGHLQFGFPGRKLQPAVLPGQHHGSDLQPRDPGWLSRFAI